MDEYVAETLKRKLGEDGFQVVVDMIAVMESESKATDAKAKIRRIVESASN